MNLALLGLLLINVCLAADPCQGRYPNNACPRDNSTIIYQDQLLSRPGGKINLTCCFQVIADDSYSGYAYYSWQILHANNTYDYLYYSIEEKVGIEPEFGGVVDKVQEKLWQHVKDSGKGWSIITLEQYLNDTAEFRCEIWTKAHSICNHKHSIQFEDTKSSASGGCIDACIKILMIIFLVIITL